MEISVTDGVTTVTTVLRVEVSLLDNNGPQPAPGCLLAVTVASKSSVTLSRLHLAYIVSFHLFLNPVNAASSLSKPFATLTSLPSAWILGRELELCLCPDNCCQKGDNRLFRHAGI